MPVVPPGPRTIHKLGPQEPYKIQRPGYHNDGGGLYLVIGKGGPDAPRKWIFRYRLWGRRREMGLGSLRLVNPKLARQRAADARSTIAAGTDPIDLRALNLQKDQNELNAKDVVVPRISTFGEIANDLIKRIEPSFRGQEAIRRWKRNLNYCGKIVDKDIESISVEDVLSIIEPKWRSTPAAAERLRSSIEKILAAGIARGYRQSANVAAWNGRLEHLLLKRSSAVKNHYPAMPHNEVKKFITQLRLLDSVKSACAEFCILTASRPSEAREAAWSEFDFGNQSWNIPAERMKEGREHSVPLSRQVLCLLDRVRPFHSEIVFPSRRRRGYRYMSKMFSSDVMRNAGLDTANYTLHGFRSSFRDWVTEETEFSNELAELSLSHATGSRVERAYRRSNALERRRVMMQAWADYICPTLE